MFKKYKQFIVGFLIGAMLFSSVSVFAETRTIEALFNNIKLSLDGKLVELKDVNGNPVEIFSINGTTYLPVRALSEALGLTVKYNETTNTIELSKKEETVLNETTSTVLTTEIPISETTNNLVIYEENGLTIVETNREKFVELNDVIESLKDTEYQLYYYGANYYVLQKLNADNKYENISTIFKSYNHKFDVEYNKMFNNHTLYLKYEDYINFIKNKIEE